MMTAIPLVNPVVTGYGMNLMSDPSFVSAHEDEHDAGHDGGDAKSVISLSGDDTGDDGHERARGSADLNAAAAEQ